MQEHGVLGAMDDERPPWPRDPPGHGTPKSIRRGCAHGGEQAPWDAGCRGAERAEEHDRCAMAGHTQHKHFPVPIRKKIWVAVTMATPLFKHCC